MKNPINPIPTLPNKKRNKKNKNKTKTITTTTAKKNKKKKNRQKNKITPKPSTVVPEYVTLDCSLTHVLQGLTLNLSTLYS